MIVEAVLIGLALLLAVVFFKSAPPTPPSYSTHLRNAGIDIYSSIDSGDEQGGWLRLKKEYKKLMQNKDYVILLVSFSLGLGLFNTFLTLIYQIIEPWGYRSAASLNRTASYFVHSNNAAGTFGAVLIVCGLLGAASAGTRRLHLLPPPTLPSSSHRCSPGDNTMVSDNSEMGFLSVSHLLVVLLLDALLR
jgi:hypothetical protein